MKNREFWYSSRDPVDPKVVHEHEERQRSDLVERFKKDPKLEQVLSRVKFDVLRDVFVEYAKKVGISKKDLNVLDVTHIHSGTGSGGSYSVRDNLIGMSSEVIERMMPGVPQGLAFLKVLVHEETHAVSGARCLGVYRTQDGIDMGRKFKRGEKYHIKQQTGYEQFAATGFKGDLPSEEIILFTNFNEGVVEKLSREVLSRYLEKDTDFTSIENTRHFTEWLKQNKEILPYEREIALINALVDRLAQEVGVPGEVVWGAFVRGLFEAEKFENKELRVAFSEMFSEDFVGRLSRFKSDEEYSKLLKEIETKPISKIPEIFSEEIIQRFLQARADSWFKR